MCQVKRLCPASLFLDRIFDMDSTVNPEKILQGFPTLMVAPRIGRKWLWECWAVLLLSHECNHPTRASNPLHSP